MGYPVVVTEPTGEGMETIVESISNIDTDGIITALEDIKDAISASTGENPLIKIVEGTATVVTAEDLKGVKKIKSSLFLDSALQSIEFPEGIEQINASAFGRCTYLTSVKFPDTLPESVFAGASIFFNCSRLPEIIIPEGPTTIPGQMFNSCSSLTSVYLPDSITTITSNAFNGINANAVINCGFAEGAVTGAPWGALNTVTINYNVPQP